MQVCIMSVFQFDVAAQFESGKWIFGYGAGVDFCDSVPKAFVGSKIRTSEGCSSISDENGNLLFYTDGISVWNKANAIMPNGTKLNGHLSSTQSAIIVPLPGSKSIFYIFTMDSEANKGGFCYSIVDLNKDKGFGDITLKNQLIKELCTEKLVAVKHNNNKDIWIIIHEYGSNAFVAYLLTKEGLSIKPVVSNSGIVYDKSVYNTIGYLKVSIDKKKLAVAINGEKTVQVFNFDNKTGLVSNPITLKLGAENNPYGLEFSPDGKLLYIGIVTSGKILQANISSGNEGDIQKTICPIGQNKNKKNVGALQLAINGKIYIAEYQSKFLSSIENPTIVGKDCRFKQDAIFLADNTCMFGLPTFFQDLIKPHKKAQKNNDFTVNSKLETNKKYTLENVYFDFNKATLRQESIAELLQLADILRENLALDITITGHTDSIGGNDYNKKLSLARAKAIGKFLNQNKISRNRISFAGKGCSQPLTTNTDETGRQKNRRVEFILTEQEKH